MSFSKNLAAYPVDLLELFEAAVTCVEPFRIPCASKKEAAYVRMNFHAIKYAIMNTRDHPMYGSPQMLGKQVVIDKDNCVIIRHIQDSKAASFFRNIKDKAIEQNKNSTYEPLQVVKPKKRKNIDKNQQLNDMAPLPYDEANYLPKEVD